MLVYPGFLSSISCVQGVFQTLVEYGSHTLHLKKLISWCLGEGGGEGGGGGGGGFIEFR